MAHPEWKQVGGLMSRNEWLITGGSVALSVGAGLLTAIHANAVRTWDQGQQGCCSPRLAIYLNSLSGILRYAAG
jgi:hypothetical protein